MPMFANLVKQIKKKILFLIVNQLEKPSLFWLLITSPLKWGVFFWIHIKKLRKLKKNYGTCSVCVGNITLGGNGKTPLILKLIEDLKDFQPTVISKGYKRKLKGTFCLKEIQNFKQVGDEPLLIQSKFPKTNVYVVDDRLKFLQSFQPQLAIFDDGLQDSKLEYDFRIALFDKDRFSQPQNLIPQGIYREPFSSLKNVDLIGIKGPLKESEFLKIKKSFADKKIYSPLFSFFLKPVQFKPLNGFPFDQNKLTAVFCAIGNPKSFIDTLLQLKILVEEHLFLADHEPLDREDLEEWIKKLNNQNITQLVCTEKDAIKLSCLENLSIALFSLETETLLEHGIQEYRHFIENLKKNIITQVKDRDQSDG